MASTVLPHGIIIPEKYSRDWYNDLYHNWQELDNLLSGGGANDGTLTIQKNGTTVGTFSANQATDETINIAVPTATSELANDSGYITEDATKIPLAGTDGITGTRFNKNSNNSFLSFSGGDFFHGGLIELVGEDYSGTQAGCVIIYPIKNNVSKNMYLYPDGTWIWNGTAVQITSDQRLKQQINQIDDKLLDAWEDVNLVQFKYNDAVDQKKDKARLHTGYVVQQIDNACKSHGVDISEYGLYCHEEYPQETEEVEVEQADGTKTKERKVIREASEHYSLRYTEVYAVECMYLRRCIARLTARIEELEKGNNTK